MHAVTTSFAAGRISIEPNPSPSPRAANRQATTRSARSAPSTDPVSIAPLPSPHPRPDVKAADATTYPNPSKYPNPQKSPRPTGFDRRA